MDIEQNKNAATEQINPTISPEENGIQPKNIELGKNKLLFITIIIVVIIIIPSVFYILGKTKSSSLSRKVILSPTPIPNSSLLKITLTPSITPTSSFSALNEWKIYTNKKYKYSLMYPPDWTFQVDKMSNVVFYPPGSLEFAKLTENDNHPGAGVGPQISSSVILQPFVTPAYQSTTLTIGSGIQGYYYITIGAPFSNLTFDLPLNNGTKMLELSMLSIGQDNINQSNKDHNTNLQLKDIDESTFKKIIESIQILN